MLAFVCITLILLVSWLTYSIWSYGRAISKCKLAWNRYGKEAFPQINHEKYQAMVDQLPTYHSIVWLSVGVSAIAYIVTLWFLLPTLPPWNAISLGCSLLVAGTVVRATTLDIATPTEFADDFDRYVKTELVGKAITQTQAVEQLISAYINMLKQQNEQPTQLELFEKTESETRLQLINDQLTEIQQRKSSETNTD